jgi:hypothetical protein
MIIGMPPGNIQWARDVIPHEITHLVVGTLVFNCQGLTLPTWLSEGLAMYSEGIYSADAELVYRALDEGELPDLRTLANGFSAYSDSANLAYAQSGLIVTYLLDTYGPEAMSELLAAIQGGQLTDEALRAVYGYDTAGIDQAWRALLGYGEMPIAGLAPTPAPTYTIVPTFAMIMPERPTDTPAPPTATIEATAIAQVEPSLTPTAAVLETPVPRASDRRGLPCAAGALPLLAGLGLLFLRRPKS